LYPDIFLDASGVKGLKRQQLGFKAAQYRYINSVVKIAVKYKSSLSG